MGNKIAAIAAALALWMVAGAALAQSADQNTGGPTKNTLRLTISEPADKADITGSLVRVVVGYNRPAFATGDGTRFGEPNFPQPRFDVYLDNDLNTTLKGTESNVANLENVAPGSHKITVVALNVSGEIIDRKEINITTSAPAMPVPRPVAESVPEPQPAPPAEAPVAAPPVEETLPATASHAPEMALAGLAVVAAGLLIGRRPRF